MLGEAGMDLLQPRLMAKIVDEGVLGISNNGVGDIGLVISLGLRMILFVVLGGLSGFLCGVFANIAAQNFGNDVRKEVFKRVMSLSFEQTDDFTTGSLITRITNDVTQLQNLVSMSIRGFIRTFVLFIGGIICMLSLNLNFGVVVACAFPLILICVVFFLSKASPKFTVLQSKLDTLNNVMQENINGQRVVKAYVRESAETERFEHTNKDLIDTQLSVLLLFSYMTPIMNIIMNISVVAIIKVGAVNVENMAATPGDVMAAITYISQILGAITRMTMIFQSISRGAASGRRLDEVLATDSLIRDGNYDTSVKNGTVENPAGASVEFKNVYFKYENAADMIIKDFSLKIEAGETIGILGATGSGKSSLVNLIPRFYDVSEGAVYVDGVDVKDYRLSDLRAMVSTALQNSEIFSATIRENILMGRESATDDEVAEASRVAQAYGFISVKEDGMDTKVAQRGRSLSGGQKQRVAISRAILKNARILIFDDATSALDLKTEKELYEALDKYKPGQTRIIIAQRIASVMNADRIAVIDNGELVAAGSHAELMESSPEYRDIYDSQLGEANGE
ncbi:MAG: ABC transporter ATP-binding protein [Lachnospiraceae bacterium]|nr:ABC transporter ATP-binding protein [Lachnospiraceae bacterium]